MLSVLSLAWGSAGLESHLAIIVGDRSRIRTHATKVTGVGSYQAIMNISQSGGPISVGVS